MGIRLLGAALATAWFLSVPAAALAQRHDGGHREGAKNGGEHAAGGNGETHTRSGGATTQVRTGAPHIVTAGPYGMFFTEPHSASGMFFTQPYYAFRPREHVGFGLYLGYPVPFPSARFYSNAYSYPYGYYPYSLVIPTYPYATVPSYPSAPVTPTYPYGSPTPIYPYASQLPTYSTDIPTYGSSHYGAPTDVPAAPSVPAGGVQPSAETGGVSFEITPADAAVFVDGVYVGAARNFSATAPPLLLAASRHHFELRAQGYQSMTFDVDVRAGEVVPYSGTLQP